MKIMIVDDAMTMRTDWNITNMTAIELREQFSAACVKLSSGSATTGAMPEMRARMSTVDTRILISKSCTPDSFRDAPAV